MNFFKPYLLFIIPFLFCNDLLQAQKNLSVKGKISDIETRKPIPYVAVQHINSTTGTISNLEGEYLIKLKSNRKNDTITFSHLNYYPLSVPLITLIENPIIRLKPIEFEIQQVDVWPKSPHWYIKRSLEKLENNYVNKPLTLTGFYREIVRENSVKIQHVEAILDIYKGSIAKRRDKDRIKINKGIVFQDVKESLLWDYIKFVNSPYELMQSDIAKHPFDFVTVAQSRINFLKEQHFKFYRYQLIEDKYNIPDDQIVIQFTPRQKPKRAVFEGLIYIEKSTQSILRMEYYFNTDRIGAARIIDSQTQDDLIHAGAYIKAVQFYNIVNYKAYDDKLVLSHTNMGYDFVFVEKERRHPTHVSAKFDLVITDIDSTDVVHFRPKNWIKYQKSLTRQIKDYDPDFWENYNYILPEE